MKLISPDGLIANTKVMTDDDHNIDGVLNITVAGDGSVDMLSAVMTVRMRSCNLFIKDHRIRVVTHDKDELLVEWGELQERRIRNVNKYLREQIAEYFPGWPFDEEVSADLAREIVVGLREGDYDS